MENHMDYKIYWNSFYRKMNSSVKNNSIAEKLRNDGNKFFGEQEYFKALLSYNHSLCFAETGTDSVGLAFANRSATYFKMNRFELCLENIELAKKHDYPADRIKKLDKRELECTNLMKTDTPDPDDVLNFFKLSYPANKKYPQMVDCLELRET